MNRFGQFGLQNLLWYDKAAYHLKLGKVPFVLQLYLVFWARISIGKVSTNCDEELNSAGSMRISRHEHFGAINATKKKTSRQARAAKTAALVSQSRMRPSTTSWLVCLYRINSSWTQLRNNPSENSRSAYSDNICFNIYKNYQARPIQLVCPEDTQMFRSWNKCHQVHRQKSDTWAASKIWHAAKIATD